MVFIFDAKGNLCNSIPESIYEGSNEANTLVVLAPWASSTQVYMSYQLPNSLYSEPVLMTDFDTDMFPADFKANAWSIDIGDIITQRSGRVNFQFFAVTPGKITPMASVSSEGSVALAAAVNASVFATQITTSGEYMFTTNGGENASWYLGGNLIDLADYGITITSTITPVANSAIVVKFTAGSITRQATAKVSVPINEGNEIILPETPTQTIYDQILAAISDIKNTIINREFESKALLPWDKYFEYVKGDVVFHEGFLWKLAINSNTGTEPDLSSDIWTRESVGFNTGAGEIFNDYENNIATGALSHAGGEKSTATSKAAFVHGEGLKDSGEASATVGKYNEVDSGALFVVGSGTSDSARKNAMVVKDRVTRVNNLSFDGIHSVSNFNKNIITGTDNIATEPYVGTQNVLLETKLNQEIDEKITAAISQLTSIQVRNKEPSLIVYATEDTVQDVATQYIVENYNREPQNLDGIILTLTDKDNDKVLYVFSSASDAWIDTGYNSVDLSNYVDLTSPQNILGVKDFAFGSLKIGGQIVADTSCINKLDMSVGGENVTYDTTDGLTITGQGRVNFRRQTSETQAVEGFVDVDTEMTIPILPGANVNIDANEDGTAIIISATGGGGGGGGETVTIDNTTITKNANGALQAVALKDTAETRTVTAHQIWLACSIEREV